MLEELRTEHHTKDEVKHLFTGFELEWFEEKNEDGTVAGGAEKHWHFYSFVAKKL